MTRARHEVRCGLIVGADGRSSTVRTQAGIELHKDPPAHLATGLRVEGLDAQDDRTDLVARGNDHSLCSCGDDRFFDWRKQACELGFLRWALRESNPRPSPSKGETKPQVRR